MLRFFIKLLAVVITPLLVFVVTLFWRYGGGQIGFPDLSTAPLKPAEHLEQIAQLPQPPGNIAVTDKGRIFFTYHPEAFPSINVAEWRDGRAVPLTQPEVVALKAPLSLRVDDHNRLWVLDTGVHGVFSAQLLAIDLDSNNVVHHYHFPREVMGFGSHANDFQIHHDGRFVVIADASILALNPGLVVYDIASGESYRALTHHASVKATPWLPQVAAAGDAPSRSMSVFGIFDIRPGVDSIAMDPNSQWLYYAAVNNENLYRIPVDTLLDSALTSQQRSAQIQTFAKKTMSDGIIMDNKGVLYLTDFEHHSIQQIDANGSLKTFIQDPRLRWPDGLALHEGYLYISSSALHQVLGKTPSFIDSQAPFGLFRVRVD